MKTQISYKVNNNIVYSCKYHLIWCTKYRRHLLTGHVERFLKEILFQVAQDFRFHIIELEVMPDHLHLLIESDPQYGVNKAIKYMKGRSSKLLRDVFPEFRKLP